MPEFKPRLSEADWVGIQADTHSLTKHVTELFEAGQKRDERALVRSASEVATYLASLIWALDFEAEGKQIRDALETIKRKYYLTAEEEIRAIANLITED